MACQTGAEIWTQLYESAWAKYNGGWSATNGGQTSKVWKTLTDKTATYIDFTGMTNFQFSTEIAIYAKQGKWLCMATKDDFNSIVLPDTNHNTVNNHVYYIDECHLFDQNERVEIIKIVNPHDGSVDPFDLPFKYFQVIKGIYILETLP